MYNMSFRRIINMDLLMLEIMQGLSGAVAIALSIPITALLASRVLGGAHHGDNTHRAGQDA
jgi:uncharacterized membrane protein